jgi:hypothetical protein
LGTRGRLEDRVSRLLRRLALNFCEIRKILKLLF